MRKYNTFNRNYLKKHIKEILKYKEELEQAEVLDEEQYEIVLEDIKNLELFLNGKSIETLYDELENKSLSEKRKNNKEYFKQEKESIPIIREFNDTYQRAVINLDLENFICDECTDTTYTHKRLLHMVHDFYMTIPDKEFKDIFNKIYSDRIYNVRFKESDASYCGGTAVDDKQYISINNSINYPCFSNLAHEYAHAIHQNYLGKFITYANDQYTELVSIFFQLLANEYIANIGNNKERARQDSIGLLIRMDIYANNLEVLHNTRNMNFETQKEMYEYFSKFLYEEEAEMAMAYDAYLFHDYLIPYIIDLELLWEYKNDPEKSLYMLKHLINNNEKSYIEETKKLGLHLNAHEYKYIKHLTNK